jgi:Oxidoreductase molybdopterin binding domain/Mo-co oxidoreductase dimerisation domain
MNGKPVPHLHGGPVRLMVPGWVGSASLKWVTQLTLAEKEWDGPFMARSYRSPRVDDDKQTYSLQSLECKSMIVRPVDGGQLQSGPQSVSGFAWAGEGTIVAVDVSTDGGQSWKPATLAGEEHRYAWRRWEFAWDAASGAQTIMARERLSGALPAGEPAAGSPGIPLERHPCHPGECGVGGNARPDPRWPSGWVSWPAAAVLSPRRLPGGTRYPWGPTGSWW